MSTTPPLDYFTKPSHPKLWDVNQCLFLSGLFTPAFGAFILTKNWHALGQPKKAAHTLLFAWTFLSLALLLPALLVLFPYFRTFVGPIILIILALFITWGFLFHIQREFIRRRIAPHYTLHSWQTPLLLASASLSAYFVYLLILCLRVPPLLP